MTTDIALDDQPTSDCVGAQVFSQLSQPLVQKLGAPVAASTSDVVDERTYRQQVLEAVLELHDQGVPITRESLRRNTGLKMVTVDECIKSLKNNGDIWAPERGVFRPREVHPPARPMSKTILPNGTVKIEIGDEVLTLTPKESRMLAELQSGAAAQVAALEGANAVIEMATLAKSILGSANARRWREQNAAEQED